MQHYDDYNMLRCVASHNLESSNLGSNLLYCVFTDVKWKELTLEERRFAVENNDSDIILDPATVLGKKDKSFIAHLPNGQLTYPLVQNLKNDFGRIEASAPFRERMNFIIPGDDADTPYKCQMILADLPPSSQKLLFKAHKLDLAENIPGKKLEDTFDTFVRRRCKRNPRVGHMSDRSKRMVKELKDRVVRSSKKGKSKTPAEVAKVELEKYGECSEDISSMTSEYCVICCPNTIAC